MNRTQIALLAAFDVTMETLVEVYESGGSDKVVAVAYGGASALLILVKQNTDINEKAVHAAALLNQVARELGLPANN